MLVSRDTEPLRASARPAMVALVFAVIDVRARMVPVKLVPVPSVAELPTCQKTLHGEAPLISATVLPEAVINVDPTWKIQTALGLPCAFNVRVPVIPVDDEAL